jgi:putative ABC transport system permease protein
VAGRTGTDAVGAFLVQTAGASPSVVARRLGARTGTGAQVTNIEAQRKIVGSNLTAVELSGLTKIELAFALVLALAASGLSLALGFQERHHTFALARAIGARPRQLGGFVWGESLFVTLTGLALGIALAGTIAWMLVKVLTGVFDPPPDALAVPWTYLGVLVALTLAGVATAGALTLRGLRREDVGALRDR